MNEGMTNPSVPPLQPLYKVPEKREHNPDTPTHPLDNLVSESWPCTPKYNNMFMSAILIFIFTSIVSLTNLHRSLVVPQMKGTVDDP